MKKLILTIVIGVFGALTFAQSPQAIKYQTVIRDGAGALIQEQTVGIRINVHEGSAAGPIIYRETFSPSTNEFGLVTILIGQGTPDIGSFTSIDWGGNDHFVETELDPTGGTTYTSMGISQLLSVAYALHSETSGDAYWEITGDDIYPSVAGNVGIGTTSPSEKLHINGNMRLTGALYDESNEPGLNGQFLQSTASGIDWVDAQAMNDGDWILSGDDMYSGISGNVGIGTTTPSEKLHVVGNIEHEYSGTGSALNASGSTTGSMWFVQNDDGGNGIGLNAGMTNATAGSTSMGVMGYNNGEGYGVYGINQNHLNFGLLGDTYHGVYGQNSNGHYGVLGNDSVGVYGQNSTGHLGILGDEYFGVYGKNNNGNYGILGNFFEGVYGRHANDNFGFLGYALYGAYGTHGDGNFGFLGNEEYGAYGENNNGNFGILGDTTSGVYGQHSSGHFGTLGEDYCGVYGRNSNGNFAVLGNMYEGVYGRHYNDNFGFLGYVNYGAYGRHGIGNFGFLGNIDYGVYGEDTTGNYGFIGSEDYGVYGEHIWGAYGFIGGPYHGVYGYNSFYDDEFIGYLGGNYYGVRGECSNGNYGTLGDDYYGAYGSNSSGNFGYLGGYFVGVSGSFNSENYGSLGTEHFGALGEHGDGNRGGLGLGSCGVFAELNTNDPGDYAIYGRIWDGYGAGAGYNYDESRGSVKGLVYNGSEYNFSIAGYLSLDEDRSGASFGASIGSSGTVDKFGCLAYQASGASEYGGYFTSYTTGSGKDNEVQINRGIGAWGDLLGADIHGKVYGAFIEGENYATYTNGDNYTNGLDVHLQEGSNGENKVLYTNVSTGATVQTSGYAQLTDGESNIVFDESFAGAVSSETPIVVTVTPVGNSNGVYLAGISTSGFKVVENNGGKSNVTITYIAIGQRAGYENPELAKEVVDIEYTSKLGRGLHNDADTETDGEGLYYENGKLTVGIHSSTIPDPKSLELRKEQLEKPQEPDNPKQEDVSRPEMSKPQRLPETKRPEMERSEIRKPVRPNQPGKYRVSDPGTNMKNPNVSVPKNNKAASDETKSGNQ